MTRGVRPAAAIGEAKRRARAWGFRLFELQTEEKIPFDFIVNNSGITTLVRVRRLKYNAYQTGSVCISCAQQIKELRELSVPEGIHRELWLRGPQRAWHRYRISPETVEEIAESPQTGPSAAGETGKGG